MSDVSTIGTEVVRQIRTGARRNEVLHATWQDVDLIKGMWRIPETKSGYARHLPLNDGAMAVLHQMQGVSRSQQCVCTSVWRRNSGWQ